MCRTVLNDEWVSHPTWSSEDSGFGAHKKNIYEEALHRSEEERHEYDFHIEAIMRTITILEPLHSKIAQFSVEDRANFKLKAHIGGSWKAINTRLIKKIYGRELGLEVINSMQDSPVLAIPIVLKRLKQKEEEWRRSQREWNKVWREVDARNYAKSLDHQAILFKSGDKKAITPKFLVSQIEGAREEQMAKRASLIDPLFARTRPRHQLEYVIDDVRILQDALKLTFSFLDRTQGQITFAERKRIEGFLRAFTPLFFIVDPVTFNTTFVVQETNESDGSDDVVDDAEASSAASNSRSVKGRRGAGNTASSGGDLRKKLLKSEQAKSTSRKTRAQEAASSPAVSRLASPVFDNDDYAMLANKRKRNIFFTNTTFYALLRLVEVSLPLICRITMFQSNAMKIHSCYIPGFTSSETSQLSLQRRRLTGVTRARRRCKLEWRIRHRMPSRVLEREPRTPSIIMSSCWSHVSDYSITKSNSMRLRIRYGICLGLKYVSSPFHRRRKELNIFGRRLIGSLPLIN